MLIFKLIIDECKNRIGRYKTVSGKLKTFQVNFSIFLGK